MSPTTPPARRPRATPLPARGEPYVWLTGFGLTLTALMITALLALIVAGGAATFWPRPIVELTLEDGTRVLGEVRRTEWYEEGEERLRRRLLRTGNYDLYGDDTRWVPDALVAAERRPPDAWMIERAEWGPAIGYLRGLEVDGTPRPGAAVPALLATLHREAQDRAAAIRDLEKSRLGAINRRLESARLAARRAALRHGEGTPSHREALRAAAALETEVAEAYGSAVSRIAELREQNGRSRIRVEEAGGRLIPSAPSEPESPLEVAQIVRAYPANDLTLAGRLGIYLDRWKEFLGGEPREANTEGGVFPAIFGTLMMTVMMSLAVAPFGVVAALYLREYARQGALVSAVRIAVNNLAGVPSIVFGVFGLGFFCYTVGGSIDALFFPERLPAPTFGTGGILWASLTLALLTVPVVIVATEEALAAVPRSMREGSFACGASKWQTIRRIVLPRATPGVMTGLILAMARGAGEVAPLMITGVVKLAPELPIDGEAPWLHLERSFMHLGFHIYDVGFQSRNSEAGKPMVFTTTLLLVALVALLNLSAVLLRARLRRRFTSEHF